MKPDGALRVVGGLLDLPILDCEGNYCGIVDDVEFDDSGAAAPRIRALLVGPGAYQGRLPRWMFALTARIAGKRIVRVRWAEVETIGSAVTLRRPGRALGLKRSEDRFRRFIPKAGAL